MSADPGASDYGLDDSDWDLLIERINDKKCTPIVGSGACAGGPPAGVSEEEWSFKYPIGAELAREWATRFGYPLEDSGRIERVAQFLAVQADPSRPRNRIADLLKRTSPPDLQIENEPHHVLASLPLPVYLTSNFDDYLLRALRQEEKDVRVSLCRWNKHIPRHAPAYDTDPTQRDQIPYCRVKEGEEPDTLAYPPETDRSYDPSPANPLVYYFHGHFAWPESLVVSEDDYFEFLLNLAKASPSLILPRIEEVYGYGTLLFLGYKLTDWNFLMLFRFLADSIRSSPYKHIAVQLGPTELATRAPDAAEKAARYLGKYFDKRNIKVFWGTCQQFIAELRRRRG
jgi:SIR2-like domain